MAEPPAVQIDVEAWARLTAAVSLAVFVLIVALTLSDWLASRWRRRRASGRSRPTRTLP